VPVHIAFPERLTAGHIRTALSSVPAAASVSLPDSVLMQTAPPSTLAAALAGSAATLTALHGLPLTELQSCMRFGQAFTRLRALTLRHNQLTSYLVVEDRLVLDAQLLPSSLEDLTLAHSTVMDRSSLTSLPPVLSGLSRLQHLRRITFAGDYIWPHANRVFDGGNEELLARRHLPASAEVRPRGTCLCAPLAGAIWPPAFHVAMLFAGPWRSWSPPRAQAASVLMTRDRCHACDASRTMDAVGGL